MTLLSNSGGSDTVVKLVCWNCGASLAEQPTPISRHDQCPCCFEVLHCCRMCRYYAPGKTIDCEEEAKFFDHSRVVVSENSQYIQMFVLNSSRLVRRSQEVVLQGKSINYDKRICPKNEKFK